MYKPWTNSRECVFKNISESEETYEYTNEKE